MDEDEDEGATDKDERWVPRRYSVKMKMKMKMKMMAEDDGMGRACKIILILELERSQIIRRFPERSSTLLASNLQMQARSLLSRLSWMWCPYLIIGS